MTEKYKIAIVGSGPGGLSAAGHAAELGLSHILLEATALHANTIQKYQKGKHVMAEPAVLPLRSPLPFEAGKRETILTSWFDSLKKLNVNVRYQAEVAKISGEKGNFTLKLKNHETIEAEHVVLGIGLQGNPRRIGAKGEDIGFVQYQLDDPDEYQNESIVVLGAGDAAIENAVALMRKNRVVIVNRRDEFARAKEGNLNAITKAIEDKTITCHFNASVARLEKGNDTPGVIVLKTPTGEVEIHCHRVIARLGAIPPREFVEACGITFPNDNPNAIPTLSSTYESNVAGLYVVGALGGYPLIKQAMNQGYEVVEYILGNKIKPADTPLLEARFQYLPFQLDVDRTLKLFQQRIPMFSEMNALLFRELIIDSNVVGVGQPFPVGNTQGKVLKEGDAIFRKGDYTTSFYTVVDGEVIMELPEQDNQRFSIKAGQFFGEMSLLSGRRRSANAYAGKDCVLVETPRRTMIKLLNSNESVKKGLDQVFIIRVLQQKFAPSATLPELIDISEGAELHSFSRGETIYSEGDGGDCMYLIRSGSVTLSRAIDGNDTVVATIASGSYFGELALMGYGKRLEKATAAVQVDLISLRSRQFLKLVRKQPSVVELVQENTRQKAIAEARMETAPERGGVISFLMKEGLGEATNALLIDENLCVGCDNCETACAETHNGISRLNRKEGASFAAVHVPISCRHCEQPHCMKDCPPDAIRRSPTGEVFINDTCIGCGNCERNCPYGVIKMSYPAPKKPGFWSWLFFGAGPGPGEHLTDEHGPNEQKRAYKCDACMNQANGPACVRACPTGAAIRLSPDEFVELIDKR